MAQEPVVKIFLERDIKGQPVAAEVCLSRPPLNPQALAVRLCCTGRLLVPMVSCHGDALYRRLTNHPRSMAVMIGLSAGIYRR